MEKFFQEDLKDIKFADLVQKGKQEVPRRSRIVSIRKKRLSKTMPHSIVDSGLFEESLASFNSDPEEDIEKENFNIQ